MQPTTAVEIRLLFESDIPAAMQLKEAAGWNQTEDDWLRLLMLEPNGCFGAIKDGRLVGTTTTTTYGKDLAWIGMVLVDPQYRRQGIAARLMNVALDYLKGKVDTIKLDATALGQPVYEKLGFEVESIVERWSGTARSEARHPQTRTFEDRDALLVLDQLAFNADRSKLIASLIDSASVSPVLVRAADDALDGYALARRGTRAEYVGPVVSRDPQQAVTLLDQVLSQLDRRSVYIDFNTECGIGVSVLSQHGFVKERDLIRMRAGGPGAKTSSLVIAIAGPEVG
ncbi:MAG TPA: GNAT family N-acetyltransferase [Pyrinomonadaceae bacterium]|jgi:GNAT superfamily N-acetyltransferase|nr:GNAT family N-acetyltransferase [Pyrinomonadaceae bacterium]